jgi:plasmid stabilization system protein ParE
MENLEQEFNIDVTANAREMLASHALFLSNVSDKAAERLVEQFHKEVNSFHTWPERYTWLDSPKVPKHTFRKILFEKHYFILYHVDGDTVYVDAMVDGRQEYSRFLRDSEDA